MFTNYKVLSVYIFLVSIFAVPQLSFAETADVQCSSVGYTVTTINGIFTDERGAVSNRDALEYKIGKDYKGEKVVVDYLLNPSHIGGIGDIAKVAYQGAFDQEIVEDYDLVEMLKSASEKVHTQKLLLVAHSQGNFYANSFYDVVTKQAGGIPEESIGVYSVATPASRVAGEGKWLTSDTDTIIAKVVGRIPFKKIMEPNTHIELQPGDDSNGHDFKDIYLKYRSNKIVSDIQSSLDKLSANSIQNEQLPCLTPPELTRAHKIEGELFAMVDPAASVGVGAVVVVVRGAYQVSGALAGIATNAVSALGSALNSIIKLPAGVSDSLTASNLAGPVVAMLPQNNLATEPPVAPIINNESASEVDGEMVSVRESASSLNASFVLSPEQTDGLDINATQIITKISTSPEPYHDYGGGRSDSLAIVPPTVVLPDANLETKPPSDVTPPESPVIVSPADWTEIFTVSAFVFQGTAEASSTISTDFNLATTTADMAGVWQMALDFSEGQTTVRFFATDSAGNQSSSTDVSLFVDSIAPQTPELSIAECAASLSEDGCLVATTTLILNWQNNNDDLDYYELSYGDTVSTTTAASQTLNLSDNASYDFSLRARDRAGNWSETATASAIVNTMPVIINEVAWAGTAASTNDEWVELYNRTPLLIELGQWSFGAEDGTPYINLVGEIAPESYFLIERGDEDEAISDIEADLSVAFSGTGYGSGLEDNGEMLSLLYFPQEYATTTMDKTAIALSGAWPGGDKNLRRSMERVSPDARGDLASSWSTNNGLIRNGLDEDGDPISGTPKARNSVNYLIAKGEPYISSDVVLSKKNSPYLVNNTLQVFQPGASLAIESGVVIKFYNDAGFKINGSVEARGTADEPIVFTAWRDDEYGGDLNGDEDSTFPAAGAWYGISVSSASGNTVFENAIFRYGGKYYNGVGNHKANLYIENTDGASVTNSVFEYSKVYGMHLLNSSSVIENSDFNFNNYFGETAAAGLFAEDDRSAIHANFFSQNRYGLYLSGSEADVENNNFSQNSGYAAYSSGFLGKFYGNVGLSNGINGIAIADTLTRTGGTAELFANALPYVVGSAYPVVTASSTLNVDSGVIVKSQNRISVSGNLAINGENSEDIIFTSVYDDAAGGDTNNDATTTVPASSQWYGIDVRPGGSMNARGFTVRYAGSEAYGGANSGGIMLNDAVANLNDALFDANYPSGIYAANGSEVNLTNARFENHNKIGAWGRKAAFEFVNSGILLANVSFVNNFLGVMGDLLSSVIASGVEFINNTATTSPANLF